MAVSSKTYEVIAGRAVLVEHAGGMSAVHPPKDKFVEDPNNKSIVRLLRNNSIRELTARELPNDTKPVANQLGQN